jgi:hypothetical protein
LIEILKTLENDGKNKTNFETFPNKINEVKVKIEELTNNIRTLLTTM